MRCSSVVLALQIWRAETERKEKEKTTPFGINLMRSQVLYRAAQGNTDGTRQTPQIFCMKSGFEPGTCTQCMQDGLSTGALADVAGPLADVASASWSQARSIQCRST